MSIGGLHGYRWLHGVCTQAGFTISKEHVRLLLTILDSKGVAIREARRLRRREYNAKGPNNLWHFDGYDKLKPYGLCIHGCIDGFFRMREKLPLFSLFTFQSIVNYINRSNIINIIYSKLQIVHYICY